MASVSGLKAGLTRALAARRDAWPWFDHLARAGARYRGDMGDRLAAAVAYYGFLSLFPVLLLGLSVLGYVLAGDPSRQQAAFDTIARNLPGVGDIINENLRTVMDNRSATGIIGLVGLAWSGIGWVDALREAIRAMWHQPKPTANIVKRKALDSLILVGLGATVLLSLGITVVASAVTTQILKVLGLSESLTSAAALRTTSLLLAVLADTFLFLYLFWRLPAVAQPIRRVIRGAVFGAVGLNVLKLVGTLYVGRTVDNGVKVYGTFAVVVGLLVWINLVSRFVLFSAAWTVTAVDDSDVAPSGTADDAQGIPAARPPTIRTAAAGADEPYPDGLADDQDRDAATTGRGGRAGIAGAAIVGLLVGRRLGRD